jgi:hypothetical protein
MWEKIQEFVSDAIEDINNDGWVSYLINPDRLVRTIIFVIIGLFLIGTLIKGIVNGSFFSFLGTCFMILWVFSAIAPRPR